MIEPFIYPQYQKFQTLGAERFEAWRKARPNVRMLHRWVVLEQLRVEVSETILVADTMREFSDLILWVVLESGHSGLKPGTIVQTVATPGTCVESLEDIGYTDHGLICFVGSRDGKDRNGSGPRGRWHRCNLNDIITGILSPTGELVPMPGTVFVELEKVEEASGIILKDSKRFRTESTVIAHAPGGEVPDGCWLQPGAKVAFDPNSFIRRVSRTREIDAYHESGVVWLNQGKKQNA